MTFDGFISYSHAADGQLAPALQRGLHRLAKPWHRRRALWIFRDQTGLSVTPALWSSIQQALDGSEWFVLLASPEAARSAWVNREIEHWIATKPAERILPVLTDGTWAWDLRRGDLSADSTAVPHALRGVFAEEPLYLDLRWARDDQQLNLRHSRFRDAVAQLAAPMHGVSKDDLEGEDVRQHRRGRRLRRVAVGAVVMLTVIASMSAVLAGHNADRATASAAEALRQEQVAAEQRDNAERAAAEAKRQEENARTQEERARIAADETQQQQANAEKQQRAAKLAAAEARRQQENARKQQELAKRAQSLAEEQRAVARQQSELAEQSGRETKRQQIIAERQQALAEQARLEAEQQKQVAAQQQLIAAEAAAEAKRQEAAARENEKKAQEAAEEAKRQEANAAEQKKIAIGRRLLNQAKATVGYDPEAALRLGVAAQQIQPGPEARSGLAGLLASSRRIGYAEGEFLGISYGPQDVIAAVNSDFTAALWNVANRSAPVKLADLDGGFTGIPMFSPDNKTLAVTGDEFRPVIFDVSDPTRPTRLGTVPEEHTTSLVFSPDSRTLAVMNGLYGEWTLWDMANRENPTLLTRQTDTTYDIAFSPDSKVVVTSGSAGRILDISDRTNPVVVGSIPGDWALIAHSPTKPLVAVINMRSQLVLWSIEDVQSPRKLSTLPDVNRVAFSPDGETLLTGTNDGGANLWDVTGRTPAQMAYVNDRSGDVATAAFSPDSRILATTGTVGSLSLWTIAAHGEPARQGRSADPKAGETTEAVTLSPDGKRLTTVHDNGSAILWDLTRPGGPKKTATVPLAGEHYSAAISPDGTIVATVDLDFTTVRLTDISDPNKPTAAGVLRDTPAYFVEFSPDGHTLVVQDMEQVTFWDITDPREPALLKRHPFDEAIRSSAFSPDGRTIAFATQRNVILYDMADRANPKPVGKLKGHTADILAVAFSPDGRTLATGSADQTAALWNVADHNRLRRESVVTGLGALVWSVAFAPDGNTLAIGTEDDRATFWDVTERSVPVRVNTMNRDGLRSDWLLFHPDGHTLTTVGGTWDKPSRVTTWDYSALNTMRSDPAAFACAAVGSGLTPDDWAAYIPEYEYQKTCS